MHGPVNVQQPIHALDIILGVCAPHQGKGQQQAAQDLPIVRLHDVLPRQALLIWAVGFVS